MDTNNTPPKENWRDVLNLGTDKLVYFDEVLMVYVKDYKKNGSETAPLEMIAAGIAGLRDIPLDKFSVEEWNQMIVELMVLLKQNFRRPLEVDEAMSEIKNTNLQKGGDKDNVESTNS